MRIDAEVARFVVSPVMIIIGTSDVANRPQIGRGVGACVMNDAESVEVVISGWQWPETVANLRCLAASPAAAQSEAEIIDAFAGDWQVVDSRYSSGDQPCALSLSKGRTGERYLLTNRGCGAELASVSGWGIADGQMTLVNDAATVATLGGNQRRMSGNSAAGSPVILERVGATGMATVINAARRASGCYYAGFTDRCAPEAELSKPTGAPARIKVLVNLNVRAEARDEADIIGVVPANSCISTQVCLNATDGVWCRAQFESRSGWLRKVAIRQSRWPVVTFLNECAE